MNCCYTAIEGRFTAETAARDLLRYRTKGARAKKPNGKGARRASPRTTGISSSSPRRSRRRTS